MSRKNKLTARELTYGLHSLNSKVKEHKTQIDYLFGNIVQYFNEYLTWKGDSEKFKEYINSRVKVEEKDERESKEKTSKIPIKKI